MAKSPRDHRIDALGDRQKSAYEFPHALSRLAAAAVRRDPAGSRLFAPCIDSPLAQPPLGPRSPESRTSAQNVVHFAPNTPFSAHPAEVDCTLSTTPTIHHTTPPVISHYFQTA